MNFIIKSTKKHYKKDLIRLMLHDLKKDFIFFLLLGFYGVLIIFFSLNKFEIISFSPKIIKFLIFVLGVGILGMLIYISVNVLLNFREIKKKSLLVDNVLEKINFTSEKIEVNRNGVEKKILWNSYKNALILNHTIFLIPTNKKIDFLRFNKFELIEGDYDSILNYIKMKWGVG